MSNKLWGGRFTGKTDPLMEAFNASIHFDRRLWRPTSRAARPMPRAWPAGMLTETEAEQLVTGLEQVGANGKRAPLSCNLAMRISTRQRTAADRIDWPGGGQAAHRTQPQ